MPAGAEFFARGARLILLEALSDTRVALLQGARQVGKSTLSRRIANELGLAETVDFDQSSARDAAQRDPSGFVAGLERPVLIDEVQRGGPDLMLAIKSIVDRDLSPGQFLLTGSINLLRSPRTLDALTGRVDVVTLWPLAQAEVEGTPMSFVDALFAAEPPRIWDAPVGRDALRARIAAGGYPEARSRSGRSRARWFDSYLRATLERDLESVADAYRLEEMPRLLRLLASQTANLFVPATLGGKLGLDHRTVERYIGLLEATFLVKRIPAWRPGLGQREIQHPKAYVVDSGLLLHLLGANEGRLLADDQITGKALESFVAMEVVRQAECSEEEVRIHHYRRGRDEIDLILESRSGDLAAIEVKARASLIAKDWRSMEKLRQACGSRFRGGFVIYTGESTVALGDRLFAVPLSGLWST